MLRSKCGRAAVSRWRQPERSTPLALPAHRASIEAARSADELIACGEPSGRVHHLTRELRRRVLDPVIDRKVPQGVAAVERACRPNLVDGHDVRPQERTVLAVLHLD